MDTSQKEGADFGRPRTAPPPYSASLSIPPVRVSILPELARFRGEHAPLTALRLQLERVEERGDAEESLAARRTYVRQLLRRSADLAEIVRLTSAGFEQESDADFAVQVGSAWRRAGNVAVSDRFFELALSGVVGAPRAALLRRRGVLAAQAGKLADAHHWLTLAFEEARASESALEIALSGEVLGALSFGYHDGEVSGAEAYLAAAEARTARGEGALAFEDWMRAFEADPENVRAAMTLADILESRGRRGAAEEVRREHFRLGAATTRAAYYQRRFHASLESGEFDVALASALEAELDVELDPERLLDALRTSKAPDDFESFLVHLARGSTLGESAAFANLLRRLVELHRRDFGEATFRLVTAAFEAVFPPTFVERAAEETGLLERASLEIRRGNYFEAADALDPFFHSEQHSLDAGVTGALAGGRAREMIARFRALSLVGRALGGRAGAVYSAVAAENLLTEGLLTEARTAAERAVLLEPQNTRAVAAQALVALRAPDEVGAHQLESSLSVLVARAETCVVLARSSEKRGAFRLALNWALRALALRPGDARLTATVLLLLVKAEEGERAAAVVRDLLERPLPLVRLAVPLFAALRALGQTNPSEAAELGGRLMEASGANEGMLDGALRLARDLGVAGAEASLLQSKIASSSTEARASLYLALSDAQRSAGDPTGAARSLRSALFLGAARAEVLERLEKVPRDLDADGAIALLEIQVEVDEAGDASVGRTKRLYNLGAAYWDAAEAPERAFHAWIRASELEPEGGLERLAGIAVQVAGPEEAMLWLERSVTEDTPADRAARLFGTAARIALGQKMFGAALRLSTAAVRRAPLLTDLLTLVEASAGPEDAESLAETYDLLGAAALGVYGERAVRYRAARQFDRRGDPERALRYATDAFRAVPAEGVAFVLMARLSDRLGKSDVAASAIREVADRARDQDEREKWLEKAIALTDPSRAGKRQRVEILLRAAGVRPEEATLRALSDALGDCLVDEPSGKSELERRFTSVAEEAISRAEGAYGAMLAIFLADAALLHFEAAVLARSCLRRAAHYDLEIPEYEQLVSQADRIAGDRDETLVLVRGVERRIKEESAPVGRAAAELFSALARECGLPEIGAEILVHAASLDPGDARLVAQARTFAALAGRDDLAELIEELLPVEERAKSLLERLSSLSIDDALDGLLALETSALSLPLRSRVLRELGDRLERAQRMADARDVYRELLEISPGDIPTLRALERAAEHEADYEELARLLRLRAEASKDRSDARLLSLRRAVILETQLGRAVEARSILADLLERDGDSWAVLRVLADSWERASDFSRAAELWLRAKKVAPDLDSVADVGFRAARAYFEAGEPRRAREALKAVELSHAETFELNLEVERACGEPRAILDALVRLAQSKRDETSRSAMLLDEASRIALELGEYELAERHAKEAAQQRPELFAARLRAAQLRVRREGVPDSSSGQRLLEELRTLPVLTEPSAQELFAYLTALARDAIDGSGKLVLEEALQGQGKRPLLAVALAERLDDEPGRALELFESAIGGEFLLMKRAGEVLLAAGLLAKRHGDFERAQVFLSAIEDVDPRRPDAARELEAVALARSRSQREEREERHERERQARDASVEREAAERTAREAAEREAAERTAREAAEREAAEREAAEREAAERTAREAAEREAAEREAAEREAAEREAAERTAREAAEREAAEREAAASETTEARTSELGASETDESRPKVSDQRIELERLREEARRADEKDRAAAIREERLFEEFPQASERVVPPPLPVEPRSESSLIAALERGDLDAGEKLLDLYFGERARSRDAVVVATHMALLDLGNSERLDLLVAAAERDGNDPLSRSVAHVRGAFGAGPIVAPPDLGVVEEHPQAVMSLLFRGGRAPGVEVLAHVWEHAGALFRREMASYGVSGVDRIPAGATSPLADLYRNATRFLGYRPALYRGKPGAAIALDLALVQPPAVLVTGDVEEVGTDFAFHFGAMLAAASPEHALLFGLSPEQLQSLFDALALSFGPSETRPRKSDPSVTKIASVLWESVPARVQRRLTQLCAEPGALSLPGAADQARRALRRAGLLISGDLYTSVADVCFEANVAPPRTLSELAVLHDKSHLIQDLVSLALSMEYSEVRFRARA